MACPIIINLEHRAALIKAKPKMDKGMGLSSKEVAPRNANAQNQIPKYIESCKALVISSLAFVLKLLGLILVVFILWLTGQ